jgi:hypothetical protein
MAFLCCVAKNSLRGTGINVHSFVFTLGMTFRTFTQHFFAEKCSLPLPDSNFFEILFPLFNVAFTLS